MSTSNKLTHPLFQVNATNTCVAECPQGNGSEAETARYSSCVEACIGAHYFTSSVGTPQPTGSSGNGNGNGNGNSNGGSGSNNNNGNGDNKGPSGTSGNDATGTGSGAAATESTGAAEVLRVSGAAAGLVGFMAAVMAL